MNEEIEEKKQESGSVMRSLLALFAVLGALYLFSPLLIEILDKYTAEFAAKGGVDKEAVDADLVKEMAQAPKELESWIPLVEAELPLVDGVNYRLIHLRMAQDSERLLVDLEKVSDTVTERFDLILVRDDFGRYVSGSNEITMKLYPPDSLPKEKE